MEEENITEEQENNSTEEDKDESNYEEEPLDVFVILENNEIIGYAKTPDQAEEYILERLIYLKNKQEEKYSNYEYEIEYPRLMSRYKNWLYSCFSSEYVYKVIQTSCVI